MSDNDTATILIRHGDLGDARKLLLRAEQAHPDDPETQFLLATIDEAEEDYAAAIHRFRRILVRHPTALRVRLELARAFYLIKDFDNAERQFRFASAGRLDPAIVTNINRFLGQIRQLRRFTYNLAVAIAPDSNLNAGPALDTVYLYGLPFQLSQAAQKHSGIGLALDAGAQYALPVANKVKFLFGGQVHRSQYRSGEFNDTTAALSAGPRLVTGRWDASLQGFGARRWYGHNVFTQSVGAAANATYYVNARLGVNYGVSLQHIAFPINGLQSGFATTVSLGGFYTPSAATILQASVAETQQTAAIPAFGYRSTQAGITVYHDFVGGFSASVQPNITLTRYDDALAAFGVRRIDRLFAAQVTVLNRRIDFHGFTPRVIVSYATNRSNLPLYIFQRTRVEMGLTRSF